MIGWVNVSLLIRVDSLMVAGSFNNGLDDVNFKSIG